MIYFFNKLKLHHSSKPLTIKAKCWKKEAELAFSELLSDILPLATEASISCPFVETGLDCLKKLDLTKLTSLKIDSGFGSYKFDHLPALRELLPTAGQGRSNLKHLALTESPELDEFDEIMALVADNFTSLETLKIAFYNDDMPEEEEDEQKIADLLSRITRANPNLKLVEFGAFLYEPEMMLKVLFGEVEDVDSLAETCQEKYGLPASAFIIHRHSIFDIVCLQTESSSDFAGFHGAAVDSSNLKVRSRSAIFYFNKFCLSLGDEEDEPEHLEWFHQELESLLSNVLNALDSSVSATSIPEEWFTIACMAFSLPVEKFELKKDLPSKFKRWIEQDSTVLVMLGRSIEIASDYEIDASTKLMVELLSDVEWFKAQNIDVNTVDPATLGHWALPMKFVSSMEAVREALQTHENLNPNVFVYG